MQLDGTVLNLRPEGGARCPAGPSRATNRGGPFRDSGAASGLVQRMPAVGSRRAGMQRTDGAATPAEPLAARHLGSPGRAGGALLGRTPGHDSRCRRARARPRMAKPSDPALAADPAVVHRLALLGLGFATASWVTLAFVVAWLLALEAHRRLDPEECLVALRLHSTGARRPHRDRAGLLLRRAARPSRKPRHAGRRQRFDSARTALVRRPHRRAAAGSEGLRPCPSWCSAPRCSPGRCGSPRRSSAGCAGPTFSSTRVVVGGSRGRPRFRPSSRRSTQPRSLQGQRQSLDPRGEGGVQARASARTAASAVSISSGRFMIPAARRA